MFLTDGNEICQDDESESEDEDDEKAAENWEEIFPGKTL